MREDRFTSDFSFAATGIGTVPFLDIEGTCLRIMGRFPEIPFWPQFLKRSPLEDMSVQFGEGFLFLRLREDRKALVLSPGDRESELAAFYERFLAEDVDAFAISRDYAPGLYALLDCLDKGGAREGIYIKGHTVGPVTFAMGVTGPDGKSILSDPDILDAAVKGLAIKALWQVRALQKSGRRPILFLDEPSLSGFGSSFNPIQRHEVIALLSEIAQYIRERSDALIGIHCCGNTDWSMIIEAGPDIVNLDAFSYLDYFLLYPKEICRFLGEGGIIAWGIVPTMEFTGKETADDLLRRLQTGLHRLSDWGLDTSAVRRQSILTPACGMGSIDPPLAEGVFVLLSELRERCREPG